MAKKAVSPAVAVGAADSEKQYYWAPSAAEFPAWTDNFVTNLEPNAKLLDVTDEEMTELKEERDLARFFASNTDRYALASLEALRLRNVYFFGDPDNALLKLVEIQPQPEPLPVPKQMPPMFAERLKGWVMRLRNHPKMTKVLEQKLGILPRPKKSLKPKDYKDYVPVLKGEVVNGMAVLDCPLKVFSGYEVWCSHPGSADFIFKDKSLSRSWTDKTPLPESINAEQRVYKVRMIGADNEPVGNESNILTLVVARTTINP